MTVYRQGDVLIRRIDTPTDVKKLKKLDREEGRIILAHGEVTGHAHAIVDKKATLFSDPYLNKVILNVDTTVVALQHEEHSTIELPQGWYEIVRQREYSPQEIKFVAD